MLNRATRGVLVLAAALAGLPLAASAGDGGMGGGGLPNARGPVYDPNKEFHAGIEALNAGKFRAAKQAFEHVLAMIPDQAVALSMLGQAEAGLGDLKGAARDFAASLRVDPRQVAPARELAIADEKLGRHDKAAIELRTLKARAETCAGACAEADDLAGAVRDVEAAMSATSQAASQSAKPPAS